MKARKEEETRKGTRRLAATDDPRPMSVPLRPQNEQLSMKNEKKGVNQEEQNIFKREARGFFQQKLQKRNFSKKNGVWKFVLFLKSKKMRIQRRDLNKQRAQTRIF